MFRDREDAGRQLADILKARKWVKPIVVAIPRGGVVTGAVIARELAADLDVVLARKLRAPYQPELAIGSICEEGRVILNSFARDVPGVTEDYITRESRFQSSEIARRKALFRAARPAASLAGRSVIVTDDGIATGATLIAALQTVKAQKPTELIVAAPVAAPDRLPEVRQWCDDVVCLATPNDFQAIGQFYDDFSAVEDAEVIDLLRRYGKADRDSKRP